MSTVLKPYSAYALSPVPWLDNVPADWKAIRLDRLFRYRSEVPIESDARVTGYLDGRVTLRSNVAGQKIKGVVHETGWQRIHIGDFAISGMNAHLGGMGVSDSEGKCSPIYLILEPRPGTNAHFVSLAVRHAAHLGAIKALVQTIRFNSADMKRADLKSIYVPIPPAGEQAQIVRFVRNLDQRVNLLIKSKRRLMELLNEQKQAIIHRAVTRGLDPTVPLKPSGIDWLGDVPNHWRVRRIRHVADMLVSNVDKHSHENEEDIRLCNYVDVYKNEAITDQLKFMKATASKDEVKRFRIQVGDVIITKDSELWSDIGVPAVVRHEADDLVCGYHLAILRPDASELSGEFLLRCLQDRLIATQLHVAANGITRYGLSQGSIKSCLVPVPPLEEQGHLVNHLMEATRDLTLAISKMQVEIDLIREYRTRLVADVVTGQLNVRHLDLPEVEESLIEAIDAGDEDEELEELETEA